MIRLLVVIAGVAFLVGGCGGSRPTPSGGAVEAEPLALQMVRTEEQMRKYPFLTLLDFEMATDPIFVRAEGGGVGLDSSRSHTGASSLLLEAKTLTVRLPSLVRGTNFPGRWTLLGMYVQPARTQRMTAAYEL